jgi:hypothetical protein
MRSFCDATLQAWIERVPREEGQEFRLSLESFSIAIMLDERLEPRDASHRLSTRGINVVDVVVVQEAQVWRGSGAILGLERQAFGVGNGFFDRHVFDYVI